MKKVIIVGATGRFGDAAARAFLNAGWRVKGTVRDVRSPELLPDIDYVECDALNREALIAACAEMDVIVHALNPKAYDQWDPMVLRFGKNVLAAARASGATVIMPGNVYNFGTSIGMQIQENAPFVANTSKAKIRIDLEMLFENARDVRTIVMRAGDFFGGSRAGSWFDLMIAKDLAKAKFAWPGAYDIPHSFAYLPDFASAVAKVADIREQLKRFQVLHFEGMSVTGEQFLRATEAASGQALKRGHVPWWALRALGVFKPLYRSVTEMSYLWDVPHSLNGAKLNALIDVQSTPLEQAIRCSIEALDLGPTAASVRLSKAA